MHSDFLAFDMKNKCKCRVEIISYIHNKVALVHVDEWMNQISNEVVIELKHLETLENTGVKDVHGDSIYRFDWVQLPDDEDELEDDARGVFLVKLVDGAYVLHSEHSDNEYRLTDDLKVSRLENEYELQIEIFHAK